MAPMLPFFICTEVSGPVKMAPRLAEQGEQLFPGIPDEVSLDQIVSKLPWMEFRRLASVSRRWRGAIRDREVFDARVLAHATEKSVIISYPERRAGLYNLRDNFFHDLPPITNLPRGFPMGSKVVAIDGKVYVLGGMYRKGSPSAEVYVLDVGGQTQWDRCANMLEPRVSFRCGVVNGKIYVFGYETSIGRDRTSEMYDPTKNAWSVIAPMISSELDREELDWEDIDGMGFEREVGVVGEELFVYKRPAAAAVIDDFEDENCLVFYHPTKDEWRIVKFRKPHGSIFVAGRLLYCMDLDGILVYNFDGNSWTRLYYHSFTALKSVEGLNFLPALALALGNEILALGFCWDSQTIDFRSCLLRGTAFGAQQTEIIWREVDCLPNFHDCVPSFHKYSICGIEL